VAGYTSKYSKPLQTSEYKLSVKVPAKQEQADIVKTPSALANTSALIRRMKTVYCLGLLLLSSVQLGASFPQNQIALSQPLTVRWRYESDRTSNFTPANDAATVYLPLSEGLLVALNASDGQLRWKADIGGNFSASPVADDRNVYAAGQYGAPVNEQGRANGTLRALSKTTGVTVWMRTLQAPLSGSLLVAENALFAGGADGKVYAFDKHSGLTLWTNQYDESFSSQPAAGGQFLYIGSAQGSLFALDQATGKAAWRYQTHGPIQGPMAIVTSTVYFGSGDGYIYALRASNSKLIWRRRTGAAVQSVVRVENGLLAASLDNFVYLLSANKGSLIWRRLLPGRISARPITTADGALFTPLSTDSAIVLGLRDGKPVNTLSIGEENSTSAAPITVSGLVLVTTPHGLLAFARPPEKP
jgi:outer membrane protein assembly factor BamB